jgi:D-amino-acid dehydrogenase
VNCKVVSKDELLKIEPALRGFANRIVAAFTPRATNPATACLHPEAGSCAATSGMRSLMGHDILGIQSSGGQWTRSACATAPPV